MKSTVAMAAVICGGLALASARAADGHHGTEHEDSGHVKAQATCPVMGGKINKKLYADAGGKRIYVCCPGCIAPIKKNPGKYIKKLEDQGVSIARLQTTCPVMGGKINKKLFVDTGGKRIYVCCQGCIAAIKKDPGKYVSKLEKQGISLDRVPTKSAGHEGHDGHKHH